MYIRLQFLIICNFKNLEILKESHLKLLLNQLLVAQAGIIQAEKADLDLLNLIMILLL